MAVRNMPACSCAHAYCRWSDSDGAVSAATDLSNMRFSGVNFINKHATMHATVSSGGALTLAICNFSAQNPQVCVNLYFC